MGASESIYGARGVESGAAEPEGQLMHRTPLSPALVADWQYVVLASGPHSGDPGPSGSRLAKMRARAAADKELIFWIQDSSAQQQKQHVLYRGWYYFVAAILQRLSISTDATRFPPTQPGAVALA